MTQRPKELSHVSDDDRQLILLPIRRDDLGDTRLLFAKLTGKDVKSAHMNVLRIRFLSESVEVRGRMPKVALFLLAEPR